jgi:hypothetical protein
MNGLKLFLIQPFKVFVFNQDCPLEPKHRCWSGALAAIFGHIRAGGGAPACTIIPMDNPGSIHFLQDLTWR